MVINEIDCLDMKIFVFSDSKSEGNDVSGPNNTLPLSEYHNRPGEEQMIEDHAMKLDETEGSLIGKCPMSSSKKRFMKVVKMYQ